MNIHTKCELIAEEKLIMSHGTFKEANSYKTWSQGCKEIFFGWKYILVRNGLSLLEITTHVWLTLFKHKSQQKALEYITRLV